MPNELNEEQWDRLVTHVSVAIAHAVKAGLDDLLYRVEHLEQAQHQLDRRVMRHYDQFTSELQVLDADVELLQNALSDGDTGNATG